jgi:hypothetical protein
MSTQPRKLRGLVLLLVANVSCGLTACDEGGSSEASQTTAGDPAESMGQGGADASVADEAVDDAESDGDDATDTDDDTSGGTSEDETEVPDLEDDTGSADDAASGSDDSTADDTADDSAADVSDEAPLDETEMADTAEEMDAAVLDDEELDDAPSDDTSLMDDAIVDDAIVDDTTADDLVSDDATDDMEPPTDDQSGDALPLVPSQSDPAAEVDSMGDPVENPATCPEEEPEVGDPCDDGSACKYGSDPNCRSRWICSGGSWFFEFAKRGCEEVCPAFEPSEGDPCTEQSAQCAFGEDPACRSLWMCYDEQWYLIKPATNCEASVCPDEPPEAGLVCGEEEVGNGCLYPAGERCGCRCYWGPEASPDDPPEMSWSCGTTSATYPPSYLTNCPFELPEEGTECDTTTTCGYITGDTCEAPGSGITSAECVVGVWVHQEGP